MTSSKEQQVNVMTKDGQTVEIRLEDWIGIVIDRSLEKHKVECPLNKYKEEHGQQIKEEKHEHRISKLEWKMAIVQWVGGAIGLYSIAQIIGSLAEIMGNK